MPRTHTNWSKHFRSAPSGWAAPASEAEVAGLVARASATGRHVKVVGGGHSLSDIAMTDGILVTLDRMRRVLYLDEVAQRVTVQGGIRLFELVAALARRGMALPILGSVTRQSIAGAISTGTHGSSLQHANLANGVQRMRLVTGRGELLSLDEPDERLAAARVGLGALGVITEVTLRCEPLFTLREEMDRVPIERLIRDLDHIARSAEFVKIWWLPTLPFANVYHYTRTDQASTVRPFTRWADEAVVNRFLFTGLIAVSRRWPWLTPSINRAVGTVYLRPSRRIGRYDQVLTIAMPPVHREVEYAVGMAQASDALDRVRRLIDGQKLRVNFVMEIRFVKGDDAWMSPAYGRETCQIGAYMAEAPDLEAYFAGVERIMQGLGGRPHWGKEHTVTSEYIQAVFPMAARFRALRKELDPDGTFDNASLRRAFGPD